MGNERRPDERLMPALMGLDEDQQRRVLAVLRPFSEEARRMSGMARLNTLLGVPQSEQLVQSLPAEDLYFLVRDIGVNDTVALVRQASQEQLASFVDLGAWTRDRFSITHFEEWFAAAEEAGESTVRRFVSGLDPELVVLVLMRSVIQIWDKREVPEDVPDEHVLLPSPDGAFQIEMIASDPRLPLVKTLVASLYEGDIERGRRTLQACRWEMPSNLEEQCYQWRSGRLEEMGFVPVDEAMEIEAPIALDSVRGLAQDAEPPAGGPTLESAGWLAARMDAAPFLERILRELTDPEVRETALLGFVVLLNRRLSARGLETSEWSTVEEEAAHCFRVASIGLERTLAGTTLTAEGVLARVPLRLLYRAGNTALRELRDAGRALAARAAGEATTTPFDPPFDLWLEGVCSWPPLRLETAPTDEGAKPGLAPFRSLSEVDHARDKLHEAETILGFFESQLGYQADRRLNAALPDAGGDIRFSTVLRTMLVNGVLGREARLAPLRASDLPELLELLFVGESDQRRIAPVFRQRAAAELQALVAGAPAADQEALERFMSASLDELEEALAGLEPTEAPDLRFLGDVLLTSA